MTEPIMLFAAGFGTRMRPLTETRPKPLIPVAGRALLDHALDLTPETARRVVNAHYLSDQIVTHLAHRPEIQVTVENELLDTGGGLRAALPLLGPGPVITLNTDAVWRGPNPLDLLRGTWRTGMEGLLLLIPKDGACGHGGAGDFLVDATGGLTRGPGAIYTGAQIVDPAGLHQIPDRVFSLNQLWDRAIARGRLHGLLYPGRWCDVGRPENIATAEALLEGRNV